MVVKMPEIRRFAFNSASVFALLAALASPVLAQDVVEGEASEDSAAAPSDKEIIVTGTLIRGIAPVGTNVVAVTTADVVATGAASTNDLMSTIPQISNFNSFVSGTAGFGQPIAATNLRGLGASGGTTTLLLVNGHRLVGSGILQTYADPTIIPPGMIERVEVIPDGGSSIYGSDAIGGVINFITRKRASGVEASGRVGFADGYRTVDANLLVGKDWGTGSLMVGYNYAWHNNIQGLERDYVTQDSRAQGGTDRRVATCALTNITVAGVSYAMPGRVAGTQNKCDSTDYADIYPRERRHSVYAVLDNDMSDTVNFNMQAYYSRRDTVTRTAPLATNGTIRSTNPFFQAIGSETSQGVLFDYTSVFGDDGVQSPARFDSMGITPTFNIDIGGNWNVLLMGNYGHSFNATTERAINADAANAALAGTTTATALNPYNLSQTNPAVLAGIADYQNYSQSKQDLGEARIVLDGPFASLPGGDARVAIGAEYHWEKMDASIAFGPTATPKRNRAVASRRVKSVYGEVFVPVFGADNAQPGLAGLDLTGSVRYDSYDDVGGTTNPKVGFNYRPVEWMTFRGNYGTSFHAPSLADTTGAVDARVTSIAVSTNLAPGSSPADFFRPILFISGGSPTLQPEKANTWSLGVDIKPPVWDALNISLTYYNVDFTNVISVNAGNFLQGAAYYADPTNAPFYILNPTLAQAVAFSNGARADNFSSLQSFFSSNSPTAIYDLRRYNRGQLKQDGLDFTVSVNQKTGFGSINASFAGTYVLNRNTRETPTAAFVDRLKNGFNRLNYVASLGADVGAVTARATLTHRGSFPIIGDPVQARVKGYDTVDLYFAYDLGKIGMFKEASLTLNIDNVADQDPPFRNTGNGFANGSTLGRLVAVGLRTKL